MLKQIRATLKNVLALFVILLLILAFAAWGVPEMRQLTRNDAIRIGGEGVSALDVQKEFDRFVTNRRLANDGQFDREAAIAAGMQNQIVQSLAARSALDHESRKMGLSVSREMVREFLQTSEQFKNPRSGKFDNEALNGILREYNYGIREFEDRVQSDLLRNQLMSAIGSGGRAPKGLVDALVLRETENRAVSYVTITDDMISGAPAATPEALQEFYRSNQSQFMAPEYRTFTAIILKNSDYAEVGAVSDEDLRKTYEAVKSKYETPERRTVYQITYPDEASAKAALDALKGGKPFETLASDNGQSLAEVTLADIQKRDILDPKVGEAVFAASETGATIGPIKGVFGFSIAQVAAISPASVKTFEDVRSELESEAQSKDSKKRLFDAIESIESARDAGLSLADAAAKAGTIAIEYGPVDSYSFGKGGEIVAGVPGDVLREAFKLEEGDESEGTEFADKSGYFFISVNEVTPPAVIPYEQVADEVASRYQTAMRDKGMTEIIKSVRDDVEKGKSLKDAAEKLNRAPIVETVTRRSAGQTFSAAMVEQIFSASKGEALSGPAALGDAQVIVTVDEVAFDTAKVSPDDIAVFAQYVGNQLGQELVDAYSNAVVADAKVKISQAQIDALFTDGQ